MNSNQDLPRRLDAITSSCANIADLIRRRLVLEYLLCKANKIATTLRYVVESSQLIYCRVFICPIRRVLQFHLRYRDSFVEGHSFASSFVQLG